LQDFFGGDQMINQTISHYKILAKLGAGGMGVVYKAEDTKLKRAVALKFLPPELSRDDEAKERFVHEAQAASALDHPNICTIYEIGETEDEQIFIAMAYYEGETLKQQGAKGKLQTEKVIDIAIQIAQGLAKAHEHGITHRDIKPANVMITKDGIAKILDFGLAKLAGQARLTKTGSTVGTPAYISPEQIQLIDADHRSDIWSLGVVMYEMLTGRLPFEGEYEQAMMYAIVNMEPEAVRSLKPELPAALESIVHKCLAKEPEERYQTVSELQADLKSFLIGESQKIARKSFAFSAQKLLKRKRWVWVLTVSPLAIIGATLFYFFTPFFKAELPPMKTTPFTSLPGLEAYPAFSPDGKQIAFSHNRDIYVQLIGTNEALQLTKHRAYNFSPQWSPDGRQIAFARVYSSTAGMIGMVSALGGAEREIYSVIWDDNIKLPNLSWSPDGKWFAYSEGDSTRNPWKIFLLSVETLEKRRLTSPPKDCLGDKLCAFSPDSKMLAVVREFSAETDDIYLVPISGGEPKRLTFDQKQIYGLTWTPDGKEIIFCSNRDGQERLWRIKASGGDPKPLDAYGRNPASSRQGHQLAYQQYNAIFDLWRIDISSGKGKTATPYKFIASTRVEYNPQISPDQTRIVFGSDRSGSMEIWRCDSSGLNPLQLTHIGGSHTGTPRWSPDGKYIAFDSRPEGHSDIHIVSAEGGTPRRLTTETSDDFVPSWSRDGRWVYFTSNRSGTFQIWKMPIQGGSAVQVTKEGGYAAFESFDGKWVYYAKGAQDGGIWKTPVAGGKESLVIDVVIYWGQLALAAEGVYYNQSDSTGHYIKSLNYETGKITTVARLPHWPNYLTVSLDGRWLVYSIRQFEGDIMLVENFR
jgi:Tol biopolymer transport system component/predicted Ser/Thr protein kinase